MNAKEEMIKYSKLLHLNNLVIGSGGNISVKEAGKDVVQIKKKGVNMSCADEDSFLEVGLSPEAIARNKEIMSSEYPMHIAVYKTREEVKAIIHTHSPYAIAVANRIDVLEKVSYELEYLLITPVPVIEYIEPGSQELAEIVAEAIKKGANAVLLKKHGVLSVGSTLQEAFLRALAVERAAITFLHS